LVTTNAILLEFGNAFSGIRLRPAAVKMIQAIRGSGRWNLVRMDDSILDRGFQKYRHVMDKEWGLVDCISMVVAEDLGISKVFTTDHHFEQAGFDILLKK
jgi:predicted nucleic acid-binding protein